MVGFNSTSTSRLMRLYESPLKRPKSTYGKEFSVSYSISQHYIPWRMVCYLQWRRLSLEQNLAPIQMKTIKVGRLTLVQSLESAAFLRTSQPLHKSQAKRIKAKKTKHLIKRWKKMMSQTTSKSGLISRSTDTIQVFSTSYSHSLALPIISSWKLCTTKMRESSSTS